MKEENRLLILWVIFGFVFIKSITSILYFLSHLIVTIEILLNPPLLILQFSYPIITIALYILTTLIILKKLKITSELNGIYLTSFPKNTFLILAVIAVVLPGLTNYLIGAYSWRLLEDYVEINNLERVDYLSLYGMIGGTLGFANLVVYISLAVGFFYLRKEKTNTN